MSEQSNIKVVQDAYAAFGRNDIQSLIGLMSDDIAWHTFGPAELPMCGLRKGKAAVQKFFDQVGETWNFERFEPREFTAQGDTVVALGFYGGTCKGTKRPFMSEFSHVFTLRDDKVVRFREYADTANLLAAYSPAMSRA